MTVKFGWLFPIVLCVVGWAEIAEAGKLTYWRFNSRQSQLEFTTNAGVQPQALLIMNPTRLVIDLPNTVANKPKDRNRKRISKYIKQVRVAQFNKSTTRIVVELGRKYTIHPGKIRFQGIAPNRWVVKLPNFMPRSQVEARLLQRTVVQVPRPQLPKPTPVIPVKRGAQVVVIDPGHGGRDPGAVGRGGLQEKHVVLSISKQVAEKLRKQGVNAALTRTGDQEVDLRPRVAKAEGLRARAFVSIHANAISMSRPDINGLETYYYSSGYRLARNIHNSILQRVSVGNRGIRRARFYVLRKTSMPAVLVEVGFVTGRVDANNLRQAAHRTRLAEAISQGILQFLRGR